MSCRKSKNLVLYFYDELAEDERLAMQAHLQACSFCRKEFAALEQVRSAMPEAKVREETVQLMRRALFFKLRSQRSGGKLPTVWSRFGKPAFQAGLAAALVLFGFWLGDRRENFPGQAAASLTDLITADKAVAVQGNAVSPYLLGIDKITINPTDGTIEIDYNTLNKIAVRGDLDDPAVQTMLQNALLADETPSVRLRALKTLEQSAENRRTLDEVFVEPISRMLLHESTIGIKLAAVKTLQFASQSAQARQVLIQTMLGDKNKAVRIQAFKSLTRNAGLIEQLEPVLTRTQSDSNTYIRTKSLQFLKQGKDALL